MSQQQNSPRQTFANAADLSDKQYHIVKSAAASGYNKAIGLATAATDFIVGTLNNAPVAGEPAEVIGRWGGQTGKVKLGGTVAIGDKLTTNASSQAIVTTTTGNEVFGRALEAGVSGDVIEYGPTFDRV